MASKRKRKAFNPNATAIVKEYSMTWEAVQALHIIELHQLLAEPDSDNRIDDRVWLSQYKGFLGIALRMGLIPKSQPYKVTIKVTAIDRDTNQQGNLFITVVNDEAMPLVHFFNMDRASIDDIYIQSDGSEWRGFEPLITEYVEEVIPNSTVLSIECELKATLYFNKLVSMMTLDQQLAQLAKEINNGKARHT